MKFRLRMRFNPYHHPAGSPQGGQFAPAPSGGGPAGSYPIQHINFAEAFSGLPKPMKKPLDPAILHELTEWADIPEDYLNLWERARDRQPWELQNAWNGRKKYIIRVKFNPYHNPPGPGGGQFSTADHSVDSPDQLMSYMRLLRDNPGYYPNIIGLKVAGKQIFNPTKSAGISRLQMPQIPSAHREEFLTTVPDKTKMVDPTKLYPTQDEIDGSKTAAFALQKDDPFRPPLVSNDNYVLDGHHNWASAVVKATINPGSKMEAHVVDLPRDELLARMRTYADAHGFPAKPIYKFNPNHDPANGQFATGEGGARAAAERALGPFTKNADPNTGLIHTETPQAHAFNDAVYKEQSKWFSDHPKIEEDVNDYMGAAYDPLNNYLRYGAPRGQMLAMNEGAAKSMAARLERAIKEAPELPDGTQLYRSFRSDRVAERAEAGDLEGKVYQDKAFLSTTANPYIASIFADKDTLNNTVIMRMTTHDGVRGLYAPAILHTVGSYRPGEYEVILNKSTPMEISKVTRLSSQGPILIDAHVYGERAYKFNPNHDPTNGQFSSGQNTEPFNFEDLHNEDGFTGAPAHNALVGEAFAYRDKLVGQNASAIDSYQLSGYLPVNRIGAAFPDQTLGSIDPKDMRVRDAIDTARGLDPDVSTSPAGVEAYLREAQALETVLNDAPLLPDGTTVYRVFRNDQLSNPDPSLIGQTFKDSRFLSTTADQYQVWKWGVGRTRIDENNVVLMKLTTKDARGLYLTSESWSKSPWEYEVLFNRNTPVTVTNVRPLVNADGEGVGSMIEGTIGHG